MLVVGRAFIFAERDIVDDEPERIDEHDEWLDAWVDERWAPERIPFVHGDPRRDPASTATLDQQHASLEWSR
ncbi:MAG: hypothetical protein ACXVIH_14720 [Ilumatobacteraceae bacterium]